MNKTGLLRYLLSINATDMSLGIMDGFEFAMTDSAPVDNA